jgi:hypothetical protein
MMDNLKNLGGFFQNAKYLKAIVILLLLLIVVITISTIIAHWKIFTGVAILAGIAYLYKKYLKKE